MESGILDLLKDHAVEKWGRRSTLRLPIKAWEDRLVKDEASRGGYAKPSPIPRIPVNRVFKEGMVYVTEENYRKLEKFLKPGEFELS